eukprot:TRINITY_DN27351_c0_g1_i1.p1 TRINITY_DN27351_c0_g1~~TRINITY_DN27351_c0_g1_i1.p1  ORF type:complete len:139 (+),score=32.40 TRINITY_DN27351_c0_g1_i1:107-523(+)
MSMPRPALLALAAALFSGALSPAAAELRLEDAEEALPARGLIQSHAHSGPARSMVKVQVQVAANAAMTEEEAEELATEREKWGAWDDSDGRRRWGDFTVCRRRHDIQHDGRRRHEDRSFSLGDEAESSVPGSPAAPGA